MDGHLTQRYKMKEQLGKLMHLSQQNSEKQFMSDLMQHR